MAGANVAHGRSDATHVSGMSEDWSRGKSFLETDVYPLGRSIPTHEEDHSAMQGRSNSIRKERSDNL